jgi:NAD(P)H-flavin reductase
MARIVRIYSMVDNNYLFTLRFVDEEMGLTFRHKPGQFVMLSIPGTG